MIVEMLPNKHESIAMQHGFRPWQMGLLDKMFSLYNSQPLVLNMGRQAGHTYFSRTVALSDFPSRTKVYVACQQNLSEFSGLLFDETKVHEPIESLDQGSFRGYQGEPVDFVVVDMSSEHPGRFKKMLKLLFTTSDGAKVVLLQPNFFGFSN
jgi:hypothetical protein